MDVILLVSSSHVDFVLLISKRVSKRPSLQLSASTIFLTGSAALIFWEEKSQGFKPVSSVMYMMFLALIEWGSLDTI